MTNTRRDFEESLTLQERKIYGLVREFRLTVDQAVEELGLSQKEAEGLTVSIARKARAVQERDGMLPSRDLPQGSAREDAQLTMSWFWAVSPSKEYFTQNDNEKPQTNLEAPLPFPEKNSSWKISTLVAAACCLLALGLGRSLVPERHDEGNPTRLPPSQAKLLSEKDTVPISCIEDPPSILLKPREGSTYRGVLSTKTEIICEHAFVSEQWIFSEDCKGFDPKKDTLVEIFESLPNGKVLEVSCYHFAK